MMNRKIALSLTMVGLLAANVAFAIPGFTTDAPKSSVETCVAEVAGNANFNDAATVVHNVLTEDRRVSGHKMSIRTIVLADDGKTVIREYASNCAINGHDEVQRFTIRQKAQ